MKRKELRATTPPHDYRQALHDALSWLGDGYLLAQPVARLAEASAPYFTEPRRWHPVVVAGALALELRTERREHLATHRIVR